MLTCDFDYDFEPGTIFCGFKAKMSRYDRPRATRCRSCGKRIAAGDAVLEFIRWKIAEFDVEIRIYGEDGESGPPRASWFHCADCANIYTFLNSFGYAIDIAEDMRELSREHGDLVKAGAAGCL